MLAEHPDIIQRLREEILVSVSPTARPTQQSIKDLKYLRAFINGTSTAYIKEATS